MSDSDRRGERSVAIDTIVNYIRRKIKETKKPWVSWGELQQAANEIFPGRHPSEKLWSAMEPFVFSISEAAPHSRNPRIFEIKLGQAFVYYPVEMIENL